MKRGWQISIIGILLIIFTMVMFYKGYVRFNYPSYKEFPIQGIDISHHQGDIDWNKLRKENISFVFIKATEGGDFKDKKFQDNLENAKNNGLAVGAYHFYRLCKNGLEQADNFIQTVPKIKSLPPVVDLEFDGNCQTNKAEEQIKREIQDFFDKLEKYYEQIPIIYATKEFYDKYLQNQFIDYPIWIRDIYKRPTLKDNRNWTFWQFANRGHLSGIEGYVDLNVFNGDKNQFEKLIKTGKAE